MAANKLDQEPLDGLGTASRTQHRIFETYRVDRGTETILPQEHERLKKISLSASFETRKKVANGVVL